MRWEGGGGGGEAPVGGHQGEGEEGEEGAGRGRHGDPWPASEAPPHLGQESGLATSGMTNLAPLGMSGAVRAAQGSPMTPFLFIDLTAVQHSVS